MFFPGITQGLLPRKETGWLARRGGPTIPIAPVEDGPYLKAALLPWRSNPQPEKLARRASVHVKSVRRLRV